jgi:hypothetical protein
LVRNATVAIGVEERTEGPVIEGKKTERPFFRPIGTGTIFGEDSQTPGIPWLVTAKHVLSDAKLPNSIRLRFAWFDSRSVYDYLGVELPVRVGGRAVWTAHPDASVDLAALPLDRLTPETAGRPEAPALPLSFVAVANDIFEGAAVRVFGYPGAVGATFWTRALVRSGSIAWVDPTNPTKSPLLIDAMLFPGNSGGPVFTVPSGVNRQGSFVAGGRPAFVGVVSQGRRQATPVSAGGKPVEIPGEKGALPVFSEEWIGIGVVEPASKVVEVIAAARAAIRH